MGTARPRRGADPFFTLTEHIGHVFGDVPSLQYSIEVKVVVSLTELDMVRKSGAPLFESYLDAAAFVGSHTALEFSRKYRLDGCGLLVKWCARTS